MGSTPITLQTDNLLFDSLPEWGPEFEVYLELKINSWSGYWGSIFQFTSTDLSCCAIGDRIPGMWITAFTTDKLTLVSQINGNGNNAWKTELGIFVPDTWYTLTISQKKNEVY